MAPRVRPTASLRRRQRGQGEVLDEVQHDLDTVVGDPEDYTEQDDDMPTSYPGGPTDTSLLLSFGHHVATRIWMQQERESLKCINHQGKIVAWQWAEPCAVIRERLFRTGLATLFDCTYKYVDRTLVSAFVERWQPETNTFHLPIGEMTITLDDVGTILRIPLEGRPIDGAMIDRGRAAQLLVQGLRLSLDDALVQLAQSRGVYVNLEWLRQTFSEVTDRSSQERVDCACRAYLLFVLGCTIFADKTGTRVPVMYLTHLLNLDEVSRYAWGAAGLAYLYRQLGCASRADVRQMGGYMTLLQAWVYERFLMIRPSANLRYTEALPRVYRWLPSARSAGIHTHLQGFREYLDALAAGEVVLPYFI